MSDLFGPFEIQVYVEIILLFALAEPVLRFPRSTSLSNDEPLADFHRLWQQSRGDRTPVSPLSCKVNQLTGSARCLPIELLKNPLI